jgi:hypothetical protein
VMEHRRGRWIYRQIAQHLAVGRQVKRAGLHRLAELEPASPVHRFESGAGRPVAPRYQEAGAFLAIRASRHRRPPVRRHEQPGGFTHPAVSFFHTVEPPSRFPAGYSLYSFLFSERAASTRAPAVRRRREFHPRLTPASPHLRFGRGRGCRVGNGFGGCRRRCFARPCEASGPRLIRLAAGRRRGLP